MFTAWVFPEVWTAWVAGLAAMLHQRGAWRLEVLVAGIVLAQGRRTVTSWFRAAGITEPYKAFYYFIGSLGRKTEIIAAVLFALMIRIVCRDDPRVLVAIDDTPTKRYGPKVEGAGIHHNPTPGPAKAKFVYGRLWVTLSVVVRHGVWGTIGLPLLAKMYIRVKDMAQVPNAYRIGFQTKLQQGAKMVEWATERCQRAGKTLWAVVDGGYTKAPFLKPAIAAGATVIARLRSDAALQTVPKPIKKRKRGQGRPRKYGRNRIHLCHKASQKSGWSTMTVTLYGEQVRKSVKLFKATYPPAGGQILVLIVREDNGAWRAYLSTYLSATAKQILEAVADRAAIEQNFHDLKEIEGIGQQQLRNFWANMGALHVNMWVHTLIELWAWNKPASTLCDRRACPWDDPTRRPSHADRRAALRQEVIKETFFETFGHDRKSRKILRHLNKLLKFAI